MELKILSFNGESFQSDRVISITLMTGMWEITILDRHAPLITSLKPSTMFLELLDQNGMKRRDDFAVGSGIVEVVDSKVKIMSDMLVDIEEVDYDKASQAREKALALMEKYKDAKDRIEMERFIEAEDMLLKSIAQLKLYDKR
jgi:F-type H+-transporting ATPase subunit epsilon